MVHCGIWDRRIVGFCIHWHGDNNTCETGLTSHGIRYQRQLDFLCKRLITRITPNLNICGPLSSWKNLPVTKSYIHQYVVTNFGNDLIPTVPFPYGVALKSIFMSSCFDECPFMWMVFFNVVFSLEESRVILTTARFKEEIQLFDYLYKDSRFIQFQKGGAQICHIKPLTCNWL